LKAKNLTEAIETNTIAVEESHLNTSQEVKSSIFELLHHVEKQGYSLSTIRLNRIAQKFYATEALTYQTLGSVKDVIAKQAWSQSRKRNVINAYTRYQKLKAYTWNHPETKSRDNFRLFRQSKK
jgi:hypothetical protein